MPLGHRRVPGLQQEASRPLRCSPFKPAWCDGRWTALLPTALTASVPDSNLGPLPRPGQGCVLGVQYSGVRAVPLFEVLPPACRFGSLGHRTLTSPSPRCNSPWGGALIYSSQPGHQPPHSQPQLHYPVLRVNTLLG